MQLNVKEKNNKKKQQKNKKQRYLLQQTSTTQTTSTRWVISPYVMWIKSDCELVFFNTADN